MQGPNHPRVTTPPLVGSHWHRLRQGSDGDQLELCRTMLSLYWTGSSTQDAPVISKTPKRDLKMGKNPTFLPQISFRGSCRGLPSPQTFPHTGDISISLFLFWLGAPLWPTTSGAAQSGRPIPMCEYTFIATGQRSPVPVGMQFQSWLTVSNLPEATTWMENAAVARPHHSLHCSQTRGR